MQKHGGKIMIPKGIYSIFNKYSHRTIKVAKRMLAFTLAEVLITLGIIGIVAAMTVPTLLSKYQKHLAFVQFKRMYIMMIHAANLAALDFGTGYIPKCGYWGSNSPYKNLKLVVFYTDSGEKYHYLQNEDGTLGPLPDDYNGNFSDCVAYTNYFLEHLKIVKICEGNAYRDGCVADIPGNEDIAREKYTGDPDDTEELNYYITSSTSSVKGFRKDNLLNRSYVYMLNNGSSIIGYNGPLNLKIFAIDTNGLKGPNLWGHDIFYFATYNGDNMNGIEIRGGGYTQKDGFTAAQMIDRINKNTQVRE